MTDIHYSDYLNLESILGSQDRESQKHSNAAHDEMLFIIIHQVYELWFKQILFELQSINLLFENETLDDKKLGLVSSRLERCVKIMKVLVDQVSVIETMSPLDFLEFRDYLNPASGFQSLQFRLLETILGVKKRRQSEKDFFKLRLSERENEVLKKALKHKSLQENMNHWLERMPFSESENFNFWKEYQKAISSSFEKDKDNISKNPTLSSERKVEETKKIEHAKAKFLSLFKQGSDANFSDSAIIHCLFIFLYQDYPVLHLPYKIINQMIDFDALFTKWRQAHAVMAKRMLGSKIGTGGSSGHEYLKKTAQANSVFSELTTVSSYLIPRSKRPALPPQLENSLSFYYHVSKNI